MCGIFFLIRFLRGKDLAFDLKVEKMILSLENEIHNQYIEAPTVLKPQPVPGFDSISELEVCYQEMLSRLYDRGPSSLKSKVMKFDNCQVEIEAVSSVLKMRRSENPDDESWI